MNQTSELYQEDTLTILEHNSQIVVYNDDVNTFDHVISCFIDILGHTSVQSEQLALLIHFKGKAAVKEASMQELRPMKDALIEEGLSAVIEQLT